MSFLPYLIFPLPIAIIWVMITQQPNLEGFAIGYGIALILGVLVARGRRLYIDPVKFPVQFLTLFLYTLYMLLQILLAGIDVALRVMGVRPLRPGIIAVPVQSTDPDENMREVIAGLSAHSITITPGELVLSYNEDRTVMYVHALDVEYSAPKVDDDQSRRLKQLLRILGRD